MIDGEGLRNARDSMAEMLEPGNERSRTTSEDSTMTADVYTHPGFGQYTEVIGKTLGLSQSDYEEHQTEISSAMQESIHEERPVAVLYPEDHREETFEHIEDLIGDHDLNPVYVPTSPVDSRPVTGSSSSGIFSGEERFAEFLDNLRSGATVNLHGELRNQCYRNSEWLIDETARKAGKDIEINRGTSFPEGVIILLPVKNVHLPSSIAGSKVENLMEKLYTPREMK